MNRYLEKIGLSAKEAAIYDVLIKRGELTPTQISLETKLTREYIYTIASDLEKKGIKVVLIDTILKPISSTRKICD